MNNNEPQWAREIALGNVVVIIAAVTSNACVKKQGDQVSEQGEQIHES